MAKMTLLGSQLVTKLHPGFSVGDNSYILKDVELREVHHTALFIVMRRMQADSDEDDFTPTCEQVVKYALQMTAG